MEHSSNKDKEGFNLGKKTNIDREIRLFDKWESGNSDILPNCTKLVRIFEESQLK